MNFAFVCGFSSQSHHERMIINVARQDHERMIINYTYPFEA